MSSNGYEIYSSNPSMDKISQCKVKNVIWCSMKCNEIKQCSLFDYNSITNDCRLFLYGRVIASSLSLRIGFIEVSINDYSKFNQTCSNNFNEITRFLICGSNGRYQCPSGLSWNETFCTGIFFFKFISKEISID